VSSLILRGTTNLVVTY